ncbi:MAG TPA: hypothetical protein VGJ25_07315 [Gaiellaceae bacterium]|jgi:hypothetical protein
MHRITHKTRALVALATMLGTTLLVAALPLIATASNGGPSGP